MKQMLARIFENENFCHAPEGDKEYKGDNQGRYTKKGVITPVTEKSIKGGVKELRSEYELHCQVIFNIKNQNQKESIKIYQPISLSGEDSSPSG